jgi:hypothetical protein
VHALDDRVLELVKWRIVSVTPERRLSLALVGQ